MKTETPREIAEKDVLQEARALLNRVTLPAEVNAVARELLPKLCDEIEAHRKHLEFCFHNHVMESELTNLRERGHQTVKFECGCVFRQDGLDAEPQIIKHCASDAEQLIELRRAAALTLAWLDAEIAARQCVGHDQPSHCVECALRHKAITAAKPLRYALNPKPGKEAQGKQ